jgi:pimeloyl-ACP methyl ester carboxylesterase
MRVFDGKWLLFRRDRLIVAWHEVPGITPPPKRRPVGYGVIRAGLRADSMIGVPNFPIRRLKTFTLEVGLVTLDEGETVAQVFYREEPHPQAPHLQPDAYGFIWMPEEGFQNAFAQNAPDDLKAITASVQRPIAVRCIQEPAPKPAWRSKPSWFLIAEEDRMINPKTQHFMAERMAAKVRVHPVDHTPLLTAPQVVVDIILEAARKTLTP